MSAPLVGAWRLTAFDVSFSDGRRSVTPYNSGQLIYSASGYMSAQLARNVAQPASRDSASPLEHAVRLDDAEKARAFDAHLSYAGRYRVEDDLVFHDVDFSLAPGAVGQTLMRRFELRGDALTLRYERTRKSGVTMTYTLAWTRCAGAVT